MSSITEEGVIEILKTIIDRDSGKSVHELGFVSELVIEENDISMTFTPSNPACPVGLKLSYDTKVELLKLPGIGKVDITIVGHKHSEGMNKLLRELDG